MDLPEHQLVGIVFEGQSPRIEDLEAGVISCYDQCQKLVSGQPPRAYKVRTQEMTQAPDLTDVDAAQCRPLFWQAEQPLAAAKECLRRHEVELRRLEEARRAHVRMALELADMRGFQCLDLAEGQLVLLRSKPASSETDDIVHGGDDTGEAAAERLDLTGEVATVTCYARCSGLKEGLPPRHYAAMPRVQNSIMVVNEQRYMDSDSEQSFYRMETVAAKERMVHPADCFPLFWDSRDPEAAAEECLRRHRAERRRLQTADEQNARIAWGCPDLPEGQLVRWRDDFGGQVRECLAEVVSFCEGPGLLQRFYKLRVWPSLGKENLVGVWHYGRSSMYSIELRSDGLYFCEEWPKCEGKLDEQDGWQQANLCWLEDGRPKGTIRLRRVDQSMTSNFREAGSDAWGSTTTAVQASQMPAPVNYARVSSVRAVFWNADDPKAACDECLNRHEIAEGLSEDLREAIGHMAQSLAEAAEG